MASPLCYNGETALHFIALHCIVLVVELLQTASDFGYSF